MQISFFALRTIKYNLQKDSQYNLKYLTSPLGMLFSSSYHAADLYFHKLFNISQSKEVYDL